MSEGLSGGGTMVWVEGEGFGGGTLVLFGGRQAQVVAVQERLNQFFGTTALEIDGATLAAALSTTHAT